LIDGSIKILKGKKVEIFPDFPTGGIADFTQYNDGVRGGRVRVRAKITQVDKRNLVITEIPFGTTTQSLIDSVIKANDKGKIKIKKIEDNTAEHVEISIHLPANISPDKMIDALYAFTDCEVSIAPLGCVIENDTPRFMGVSEILKDSTHHTVDLLKQELEIKLHELQEQWHFASLEQIFIENKIYRDIEEAETWEEVIEFIRKGLEPHVKHLLREVTEDDIVRLTEIRIKRISKFDSDKANDRILDLEGKIAEVKNSLANLTEFAIDYFKSLRKKYGEGRERKTEIKVFDDIVASKVAIANAKLYINREEGFIGTSLRRDEYVCDCSDIDDIIVIRKDGTLVVTKVASKVFVGKEILHAAVFKRGDKRTIYNMIYVDGKSKVSYMKRFAVTSITRDKEYKLASENKGSNVLYLTVNPNGEAEVVTVHLRALQKLRKLRFDIDFSELAIKGRMAKGNIVSKFPIKKVELREKGISTLAARKIWFDDTVQRLNGEGRGTLIGAFKGEDKILTVYQNGEYRLSNFDLSTHFEEDMVLIEKWKPDYPLAAIYWDAAKKRYYVKRFVLDDIEKKDSFISDSKGSYLELITTAKKPVVEITFKKVKGEQKEPLQVDLEEFISVKGWKAQGNQLTTLPVKDISLVKFEEETEDIEDTENKADSGEKDNGEDQITLEFND
jgi:topoisomerase-4 subunit A